MATATSDGDHLLLPRRAVVYCGACGLPPEYCEFLDSNFVATKCDPWLRSNHPELYERLAEARAATAASTANKVPPPEGSAPSKTKEKVSAPKPDKPWTTEERLSEFYRKYVPEKLNDVPSLLEKYSGKEDKLFAALTKKYGPEPLDPYYSESDDENEESGSGDDDNEEGATAATAAPAAASSAATTAPAKTRKVAGPKKTGTELLGSTAAPRVVVRKVAQKKKRNLTVVTGMETIPGIKLKDASKAFSKRFAGSSSVKDNSEGGGGQDIILQGDHMYDVAEMIVDKFGVPDSCVWLDIDGEVVPLR